MSEEVPQHEHLMREHLEDEDILEKSEQLAPQEETVRQFGITSRTQENGGTVIIDTGALKLPKALDEDDPETNRTTLLDPVALVILVGLLTFIAFITYLVYKMPAK